MCFHNIFSHALSLLFFLSLYPTVPPSTCHLMFLVQAALGSVTQVSVAFPDVAAGGGVIMIIWALPSFSPPASRALFFFFFLCVVGHKTKFVAVVCITPLILPRVRA